jgi:hypothetical protein
MRRTIAPLPVDHLGTAMAAPAARLMPAEIQAIFFNGKSFTAAVEQVNADK